MTNEYLDPTLRDDHLSKLKDKIKLDNKIIIATKKDWFTDIIESKEWSVSHETFLKQRREHLNKMKDKCEAKRTCNNQELHYCESCDLTLCSIHYR